MTGFGLAPGGRYRELISSGVVEGLKSLPGEAHLSTSTNHEEAAHGLSEEFPEWARTLRQ